MPQPVGNNLIVSVMPATGVFVGALVMVASKSTVILVVLSGLVGLYMVLRGRIRFRPRERSPLLLAALVVWAGVTALWAPDISGGALQTAQVALVSLAGMVALAAAGSLPVAARKGVGGGLLGAVVGAAATLVVGQVYAAVTGDSLWGQYAKGPTTTMNNGAAILALLLFPAVAPLWKKGRWAWAAGLSIAVMLVLLLLPSAAALLALVTGMAVFLAANKWIGNVSRVLAWSAAAAILLSPVLEAGFSPVPEIREQLEKASSSTAHRILIWEYSVAKIKEQPLAGWGMDAARHLGGGKKVMSFLELMPLHPHNGALQVWLELGLPGAVLAAALAASVFLAAGRRTPHAAAAACAACAGYLVIGSLSYGVWQTWWVAVAWILTVFIRLLDEPRGDHFKPRTNP